MVDLVPQGSMALTEAYERYCSWLWGDHDPRAEIDLQGRLKSLPSERVQAHRAGADRVTNLQLDEIVGPFASGALEALVREPSNSDRLRISAIAWREAFFPERMFLSDAIGAGHGPLFDAALGRTPFVDSDRFEGWLRDEEGQRSRIRSAIMLRELLIGLVMDGVMTSAEAEKLGGQWRLRPFTSRPKERLFDVNKEPTWSLVMTLSWIVWRDPSKVREAWDDYRTECWEWFAVHRRLPIDGDKKWHEVYGAELRPLEPLSAMSLSILEAIDSDPDDRRKLVSVKTAREDLWRMLTEGRIAATGLNANNAIAQIPAHDWPYLELVGDLGDMDYVIQRSVSLKAAYTHLRFSRIAAQATWPATVEPVEPDPADSLFDLNLSSWTLAEAAIWVGSEGRRFSSQKIADEDLELTGTEILFEALFRDPRLVATGIGTVGLREEIPAEYWELATVEPATYGKGHFVSFIDELLEDENGGQMTPFGEDKPRWHGIRLQRDALLAVFPQYAPAAWEKAEGTAGASAGPRRSARKLPAARQAIAKVFPKGIPQGLGDKERLDAINKWLSDNGHSPVSLTTLNRASQGS